MAEVGAAYGGCSAGKLDADILPTVIPVQAGIQNPGSGRAMRWAGVWIPAFAGMTVEAPGIFNS